MLNEILALVIGIVVGAGVLCVILIPKVKQTKFLDAVIQSKNDQTKAECTALENKLAALKKSYEIDNSEYHNLTEHLFDLRNRADTEAKDYYASTMALYKEKTENELKEAKKQYDEALAEYKKEFLKVRADTAINFTTEVAANQAKMNELANQLKDAQSKVNAAIEANKRAEEMKSKEDFFRLNISSDDLIEINELKQCAEHLRDAEPLNKVIWKVYYEKPTTDLIGRVVGAGTHCGIYKITNVKNGMCYVGQAVNVGR